MKKIYSLIICLLAFVKMEAQWTSVFETEETNFYSLFAVDKDRVFLGSEIPAVHRSQDGGNSFGQSVLQEYGFLSSIDFEDQNIGYAGGGCYFIFDQCPGNTFYKTVDGGETWDTLLSNMEIGVFIQIEALGNGNVFAISDYGGMYHSINGGLSWQAVNVQNVNFPVFKQMQFLDAQRGFVAVRSSLAGNDFVERLYYTSDGGNTWSIIFEKVGDSNFIADFHFTDASHGLLAVPGGKLLQTSDAGANWSEQAYGAADESAGDLFFVGSNTAYLTSFQQQANRSRIYRSTDGGNTWLVDLESDSTFHYKLFFVDAENGWVLSDYRKLHRRTGANAVNEGKSSLPVQVYPNPANEYIMIKNPIETPGRILEIFDSKGQLVRTLFLANGENNIALTGYAAGLYMLRVLDKNGNMVWSGKVIKDK